MKRARIKTGLTLTELLIASILIGIVMVGAVSIDYALRMSQKTTSQDSLLAMKVSAAMMQITRDAMKTVGDDTDSGVSNDDFGPIRNICFRYDADGDPNNYTGDEWTCYSNDSGNSPDVLTRCSGLSSALLSDKQCSESAGADMEILDLNQSDFFDIVGSGGKIDYIEITLKSLADSSESYHIITNPIYEITSRISPPGIGR